VPGIPYSRETSWRIMTISTFPQMKTNANGGQVSYDGAA
jgi:hypothetical protein